MISDNEKQKELMSDEVDVLKMLNGILFFTPNATAEALSVIIRQNQLMREQISRFMARQGAGD